MSAEFILDRAEITKKVLEIIQPDFSETDLQQAIKTWWRNTRSTGGLSLSHVGDAAFQQAELESTVVDGGWAGHISNMAFAAVLDAKMVCPYYLFFKDKKKWVRIYDSRVAMLVVLYDSLSSYLKTLEERKNKNE